MDISGRRAVSDKSEAYEEYTKQQSEKPKQTMEDVQQYICGVPLRDWFAGQALAGLVGYESDRTSEEEAYFAYDIADEMMKIRAQNKSQA